MTSFNKHYRSVRKMALKGYNQVGKINTSVMKHANLAASKYNLLKSNLGERLGPDSGVDDLFKSVEGSGLGMATKNLYGAVGDATARVSTGLGRVGDVAMAVQDTFSAPKRDALADFQRA